MSTYFKVPKTNFHQVVGGQTYEFKGNSENDQVHIRTVNGLKKGSWEVASGKILDAYNSVIENQKKLFEFMSKIGDNLEPYILSNKQFNCPYTYNREVLFFEDKNNDGNMWQDEVRIAIQDLNHDTNPDWLEIYDKSGKLFIELKGDDFFMMIEGVLRKGLGQCIE